ncbi:MAG: hypothetical protein ACR2NK_05190 [Mariniblastus sp.]
MIVTTIEFIENISMTACNGMRSLLIICETRGFSTTSLRQNISETRAFCDFLRWHTVCEGVTHVASKLGMLTFEKTTKPGTEMFYPRRLLLSLVIAAGAVFSNVVFSNSLSAFSPPVQLSQSAQLSQGFLTSQPDSIDTWISLETLTAYDTWQWSIDFTQVHPFVWSGIVLFAVLIAMIWASSDREIARLLGNKPTEPVHPKK